jgi:hypothetical protein
LETTLNSFPDYYRDDKMASPEKSLKKSPSLLLSELRTQLVDIADNLIGALCEKVFYLES